MKALRERLRCAFFVLCFRYDKFFPSHEKQSNLAALGTRGHKINADKIKKLINMGKVYDLGMDYYVETPHHPSHPPFAFSLTKKYGDMVYESGVSSSNCLFMTGRHTGTHFDAVGYISLNFAIHGNDDITPWQDYHGLKKGAHILEVMYLGEHTRDGVYESLFMASPPKIRGGTGSPVRPLAVA